MTDRRAMLVDFRKPFCRTAKFSLLENQCIEAVMVLHKFDHTHECVEDCELCSSINTIRSKLPEARLVAIADEATRRHNLRR